MKEQKVAIVGAGANGACIAADLVRAGLDVTVVDQWPENVETMKTKGVRVEMPDDESTETPVRALHLCELAELRGERFDTVFVVVNAYDTRWVCELIRPHLDSNGLVIGLQNGMMIDVIADVVGSERTLGAVIEIAAAMFRPGVSERHTPPSGTWFGLGSFDPTTSGREDEVAVLLSHAGKVSVVDDIRSSKWMKLVVNCAELVTSAILDLPLLEAAKVPGMHDFMLSAGREAIQVAGDSGASVVPIFGLEDVDPGDPEGFVLAMLEAVYAQWSLPHTLTTVLQDWRKGRHSEVDELNGLVADSRRRLGGSALANERVVELAHRIEARELIPHRSNADLLLAPL